MTYYCSNRRVEVLKSVTTCPRCGNEMPACRARANHLDTPIAALRHPEPTTPIRAVWIFGQRREGKAVALLIGLISRLNDVCPIGPASQTLGKVGGWRVQDLLLALFTLPNLRVRSQGLRPSGDATKNDGGCNFTGLEVTRGITAGAQTSGKRAVESMAINSHPQRGPKNHEKKK